MIGSLSLSAAVGTGAGVAATRGLAGALRGTTSRGAIAKSAEISGASPRLTSSAGGTIGCAIAIWLAENAGRFLGTQPPQTNAQAQASSRTFFDELSFVEIRAGLICILKRRAATRFEKSFRS